MQPQPDNIVSFVVPRWSNFREPRIFRLQFPNPQADFAMDLAMHLGIVAATPAGEDSAGRQQLRLLTPEEVAQRACAIADQTWKEFILRGWLLSVPAPEISTDEPKEPQPQ